MLRVLRKTLGARYGTATLQDPSEQALCALHRVAQDSAAQQSSAFWTRALLALGCGVGTLAEPYAAVPMVALFASSLHAEGGRRASRETAEQASAQLRILAALKEHRVDEANVRIAANEAKQECAEFLHANQVAYRTVGHFSALLTLASAPVVLIEPGLVFLPALLGCWALEPVSARSVAGRLERHFESLSKMPS